MDFFQEQERARNNSKLLLGLFTLAVAFIIAAIYLLCIVIFAAGQEPDQQTGLWIPDIFFWVSSLVLLIVATGSLYKISELAKGGGSAIATALGGTFVRRDTDDPLEQRLLNVVDEMSIAAGISVPRVYVLNAEQGINAFAAGDRPSNAVVAVTRGCLEKLNRDELQGVIAHEFSHIFNGDMRLNLRLMGVLHGILIITMIGRIMMRVRTGRGRRSDNRSQAAIMILGLALFIIGYIGVFFGNIIKAAVSRQREYLADAAAVQYTRNPSGIAGALKKIAGIGSTTLHTPKAEQASHMFFGQAINTVFATHPPIEQRIARIEPAFARLQKTPAQKTASQSALAGGAMGFAVNGQNLRNSVGTLDSEHLEYAQELIEQLPGQIKQILHQPEQAAAIIYALLVAQEQNPQQALSDCLGNTSQARLQKIAMAQLPWLKQSSRSCWLPIIELALPSLRELKQSEQEQIMACTEALVKADGKINLFEFALLAIMEYQLGRKKRLPGLKAPGLRAIQRDVNLLLSLLAHVGKNNQEEIQRSFMASTKIAPLDGHWQLLQPKALNLRLLASLLNRINSLNYKFKAKIIEACTAAILDNGKVSLVEAELLRAIGARLECPVPPLIANE